MADGQVIDPARGTTSFHHDQIDLALLEDSREIVPVGSRGEEFSFAVLVSKKQHIVLNLPRSRARIFLFFVSLRFGVE